MILRSQRPVQLTAGGVVYLSMETFGNVRNLYFKVLQFSLTPNYVQINYF